MGYSSGMLQKRVTVAKRLAAVAGKGGHGYDGIHSRVQGGGGIKIKINNYGILDRHNEASDNGAEQEGGRDVQMGS